MGNSGDASRIKVVGDAVASVLLLPEGFARLSWLHFRRTDSPENFPLTVVLGFLQSELSYQSIVRWP